MLKPLCNIFITAIICAVSFNAAAKQNSENGAQTKPKNEAPQIVGGYGPADVESPGVRKAAQFATKVIGQGDLVRVISADQQVVAGTNYSMLLEIKDKIGFARHYKAVVFVPLPNAESRPMQLLIWSEEFDE